MSCHDIGRGLNTVTKKTIELYDEDKISKEAAKELLITIREGVHWCDGNEGEAVKYMTRNRCGYCLKKVEPGKPMYDLWNVPYSYDNNYALLRFAEEQCATNVLCPDCFDKILNEFTKKENEGETQRKYIEENCDKKEWTAIEAPSGKYWNF